MEKVYVFKIALKHQKRIWRRIEIKGNQTLADFDHIIRIEFDHDAWDHLSEFYIGNWSQGGFGEINPDGGGSGAEIRINQLRLTKGAKLGHVYDFGDEIQHIITLENIIEIEDGTKYPCLISQNKPKYRYCEKCKNEGCQTIATWICIECSEEKEVAVNLCDDCIEKEHEDHYMDEILY
jgi:hypothetical protein